MPLHVQLRSTNVNLRSYKRQWFCHEYFRPRLILVRPDQNAQPEMVRPVSEQILSPRRFCPPGQNLLAEIVPHGHNPLADIVPLPQILSPPGQPMLGRPGFIFC